MKVIIRVINNLGDLERIRRELQQIVALDGKKVTITVVQRGFATGSMLPKFPRPRSDPAGLVPGRAR